MLRFFIDRPIFSSVISIIIILAGSLALMTLPIEQYPDVVPPQIVVSAQYPGASAEVLALSVAAPLEQAINGVDDLLFIQSTSSDSGSTSISATFAMGTDPDQAAINVNNRVQGALSRLPQAVRDRGITVRARSSNLLMVPVMSSTQMDVLAVSNYILLNVLDELARIPGVGNASLFGAANYAMRVWLHPDKLAQYNLTPSDIANAIREQNAQFAAGNLGAEPSVPGQAFTYAVTTQGQLSSAAEFEDIIIRTLPDGSTLHLRDVANIELGAQTYSFTATHNGQPTVPLSIYLQPGANALATSKAVTEAFERMSASFPDGMTYAIPYSTAKFVEVAIDEVMMTLLETTFLVILVTFLFLQHWRATLIPLLAIPVSIIGTFAGMQLFGFSINLLTLFGLVLAIGIVVDDAIIVMENVERLMHEEKLPARDAAVKTMKQVFGAVISATLVMVAVFVPVSFFGGLSGELYRQFAVTIAVSVGLSGIVAVTLTPALCALLLDREPTKEIFFFRWFNRFFQSLTNLLVWLVKLTLRLAPITLPLFVAVVGLTYVLINRLPTGLVPPEDQGSAIIVAQLPPVSSLSRTEAVREELSAIVLENPEVSDIVAMAGFDILAGSLRTSASMGFLSFKPWDERREPQQATSAVAQRLSAQGMAIQEANVFAFTPPPIQGLSLTGGVDGFLQIRGGANNAEIERIARDFVDQANQHPHLRNVRTTIDMSIPRYNAVVDRIKARSMGVSVNHIFEVMQSTFGSLYVNDFTYRGRLWQVTLQSDAEYRSQPDDLNKVFVRSDQGEMIPLSSVVALERERGADIMNRFNIYPAARVMGDPAEGFTTGQAKIAMEEVAAGVDAAPYQAVLGWIGEAYQLDAAAGSGALAFTLGLLFVFLILAAKYERWALPMAVASAIPFAVLGAVLFASMRNYANDIYFQIGLLLLIGLAVKNAILIVEFAAQNRQEGMNAFDAAVHAARQRFRPIVMTAGTFIVGTLPLYFASGAGGASRREIGTVVVGGMLLATTLALPFITLIYKILEDIIDWFRKDKGNKPARSDEG